MRSIFLACSFLFFSTVLFGSSDFYVRCTSMCTFDVDDSDMNTGVFGRDSDCFYDVVLDVVAPDNVGWDLYALVEPDLWPDSAYINLKRRSDGVLSNSSKIYGGIHDYLKVEKIEKLFFSGAGPVDEIGIVLQVDGIDHTALPGLYESEIKFVLKEKK